MFKQRFPSNVGNTLPAFKHHVKPLILMFWVLSSEVQGYKLGYLFSFKPSVSTGSGWGKLQNQEKANCRTAEFRRVVSLCSVFFIK
jgi:hypothetical protein